MTLCISIGSQHNEKAGRYKQPKLFVSCSGSDQGRGVVVRAVPTPTPTPTPTPGYCSDSDSGLLVDSDSGSDKKYKINNTLIVERVSSV